MSAYHYRIMITSIAASMAACSQDTNNNNRQAIESAQVGSSNPTAEGDTSMVREAAFANQTESRRVMTPLVHSGLLDHERDTFNYKPGFDPNPISFDRYNRPYMIRSDGRLQKMSSTGRWRTVDVPSQVRAGLERQGLIWNADDEVNFSRQAQNTIVFDNSDNMYMLFDTSRNAIFRPGSTNSAARGLLLHSRDFGETWTVYYLPDFTSGKGARLEVRDSFNNMDFPPAILLFGRAESKIDRTNNQPVIQTPPLVLNEDATAGWLIVPTLNADGTLTVGTKIEFTTGGAFSEPGRIAKGIFIDNHSGAGNSIVSVGNSIHVAFAAFNDRPPVVNGVTGTPTPCAAGTPSYVKTFDRVTRTFGENKFLGCAGKFDKVRPSIPDNHNSPGITVDSRGFLHIVLGAHHDNFQYMKSLEPNNATRWSTPKAFGEIKRTTSNGSPLTWDASASSYTYVGLVCDKSDVLHVVARWTGIGYKFQMVHMKKSALSAPDAEWDRFRDRYSMSFYPTKNTIFTPETTFAHQHLVVPASPGYIVYHHKVSVDRFGRLFVAYHTLEKELSGAMMKEYCRKWSTECTGGILPPDPGQTGCSEDTKVCRYYKGQAKGHDPAMIRSNDGGNTWQLISTADLAGGILENAP